MTYLAAVSPHWVAIVSGIATVLGSVGLGGMLKTWLDYRRGMRQGTDEVAMGLVDKLTKRVETLEREQAHERAVCDANLKVMRHRLNNVAATFDSLMMMIELAPDRASEIIKLVKERRAAQETMEGMERAAVAAAIAGTSSMAADGKTLA